MTMFVGMVIGFTMIACGLFDEAVALCRGNGDYMAADLFKGFVILFIGFCILLCAFVAQGVN